MNDSCCCDLDCEWFEWSRTKVVRARKPWKCCECEEPISVGERHEYIVGKYDGRLEEFRTCLPCVGVRRDFLCDQMIGAVRESFRECNGWDYVTGDGLEEGRDG